MRPGSDQLRRCETSDLSRAAGRPGPPTKGVLPHPCRNPHPLVDEFLPRRQVFVMSRRKEPDMNVPANRSPRRRRPLSTRKKLLFASVVFTLFLAVLYGSTVTWRSHKLYNLLKANRRGWKVQIHRPDSQLGFSTIPGVTSAELFPIGTEVPTKIDGNGFRIPLDEAPPPSGDAGPLVMALGCSFTFGAACPAEETFPFLVAERLQGRSINAGVCSYGLAQMLLYARKIIPQYEPDLVLVQYSPWLVDRALSCYAPLISADSRSLILPTAIMD